MVVDTVDGRKIVLSHQLRLAVYPMNHKVSYIPGVVSRISEPWTEQYLGKSWNETSFIFFADVNILSFFLYQNHGGGENRITNSIQCFYVTARYSKPEKMLPPTNVF